MQVSNRNNSVNFTSTPIHYVNLKKVTNGIEDGFVKAVFSKLNPNDKEGDCLAIEKIKETWKENDMAEKFAGIFKFFKSDLNFYNALELVGNNNLDERIVSMVKSSVEGGRTLKLSILLSKPELFKENIQRPMKNVGELMLGEIFHKAKQLQVSRLEFESAEDAFYIHVFDKVGIELTGDKYNPVKHKFSLPKEDFDKYLKYIQKEYNTDFSAVI